MLENLNKRGMKFGTETTRRILDELSSPDEGLKIIHVAGTNGKGSICEYITQILIAAGKKVGTFTSPAVFDFAEQFRIDGLPLSNEKLVKYLGKVLPSVEKFGGTSFEAQTASALYAFKEEGCEYAVIECGLGGRDDATNAIGRKEVAVISSIGLEHTTILGDTIEKICSHKAGIIKNCPAVVNALQPPEAEKFFRASGAIIAGPVQIIEEDESGQSFTYGGAEFKIPMLGFVQPYNAAAAIEAVRILKIDEDVIRVGLSRTKLAGRLQVIHKNSQTYILDGGHNPSALKPLAELLKGSNATIIYGCLSDKDIDGNLSVLRCIGEKIFAVGTKGVRGVSAEKVYSHCAEYFNDVTLADGVGSALDMARGTALICGSFTLLKEAAEWIEKK